MKRLFKYSTFIFVLIIFLYACEKTPQTTKNESTTPLVKDSSAASVSKKLKDTVTQQELKEVIVKEKIKDTLLIIGVGDIMLGTTFPANYLAPDDGKYLLKPVESILQCADITFGNHEGTLFDGKGKPKNCSDPQKCYVFKSPERYVKHLVAAGFDLMSIANNHSGDFGDIGRKTTASVLKKGGIEVAGSLEIPYTIIVRDNIRYGLAAFSPNTGTCRIEEIEDAKKTVQHLDSICDIVIVSFHGGAEGKKFQHVTRKTEIFYGEDRGNVYKFSHSMIDAGADIIFGHGPHICRALELYKGKIIAYSLGNFCTYARFNLKNENGMAPILKVFTDKKGKFLKGEIIPILQLGEGGPVIDPNNCAILKIKELTLADFPETNISISDNGMIRIK